MIQPQSSRTWVLPAVVVLAIALIGGGAWAAISWFNATNRLPPIVFARLGILWRGGANEPVRLAEIPDGTPAAPAIAPDGKRIALAGLFPPVASTPYPTSKLYLLEDTQLRVLWEPARGMIGQIAWARDGASLFVGIDGLRTASGDARIQEIARIDRATGAMQPYLENALDPAISPDGQFLAYLRTSGNATNTRAPIAGLEILALDGSATRQIVDGTQFESLAGPRFSPDGRTILFAASGEPAHQDDNSHSGFIPKILALLEPPTASAHGLEWDLWAVNTDGSNLRRLVQLGEDGLAAVFSPDGREIIAMSERGIYRMDVDGHNLRKIAEQGDHGGLDWGRQE